MVIHIENMTVNRRRYQRYLAKESAYIRCHKSNGSDFRIVGQVIDVGLGGLAFQYMQGNEKVSGKIDLTIYCLAAGEASTMDIQCEVVYDSEVPNTWFLAEPLFRRCGTKFAGLSIEQKSQLEFFIQICTN